MFLGRQGPRRRDIPDPALGCPDKKLYALGAFFCCFRQGISGMPRGLGRDVPGSEKLYARELWADSSFPIHRRKSLFSRSFESQKEPQSQKIARTAPKTCLNNSRPLPNKTRVLRQIARESSPESSAKSLSHKFVGVPFLSLTLSCFEISGVRGVLAGSQDENFRVICL